jgi:hypothetical protein
MKPKNRDMLTKNIFVAPIGAVVRRSFFQLETSYYAKRSPRIWTCMSAI